MYGIIKSWLKLTPLPTLPSFTPKDETMQIAKNPKEIASLILFDALMCPKTKTFGKIKKSWNLTAFLPAVSPFQHKPV